MGYDPNSAPEREPLTFKNHARCVVDEIITVAEAVDKGLMRELYKASPDEPYWSVQYVALDARQADGGTVDVRSGGRLFMKNNETGLYRMMDKTQRPSKISKAFAGLGIVVFPGDPDGKFDAWCRANVDPKDSCHDGIGVSTGFDAAKVIANCFIVEKPPRNRDNDRDPANFAAPLPTAVLGSDYVFTGEVRILPPQSQANEEGQQAPSQANFRDILSDSEAQASVLAAIEGKPLIALDEALMSAGISHNLQINGESVMASAVSGTLAARLENAGVVTLKDGVVALISKDGESG